VTGTSPLIEAEDLDVFYGHAQALHGVSFAVGDGETVALIGANGAGKSTLLSTIAGAMHPASGVIRWQGRDITRVPDYKRVALGISLTPEGRRLFPSLTVAENLQVGSVAKRAGEWSVDRVYEVFPIVSKLRDRATGALSGGERQAVAIARSLMSNPRLLLLDEVSLGLAPVIVEELYESLHAVMGQGTSIVLVEQDLERAMSVCDRLYCILEGRIVLSGRPGEVTREQVIGAYFGTAETLTPRGGHS
jgi:branched-chain amino acid transport system ATP-binding protein